MSAQHIATFSIDMEPMSKARARFANGRTYTPNKTVWGEARVAEAFRKVAPTYQPPKIASYRVSAAFLCGTRQRRDIDNMLKLVFDGLNGIAWADDNQVTEVSATKRFVPKDEAGIVVSIYQVDLETINLAECPQCHKQYQSFPSVMGKVIFCSKECRWESARLAKLRVCKHCGESFTPPPKNRNAVVCSPSCRKAHFTVTQQCELCGVHVTRPQSLANNGRCFCCKEHRQTYWREHRATAAKGKCAACGGSTSKKSYTRCRACVVAGVGEPSNKPSGVTVELVPR